MWVSPNHPDPPRPAEAPQETGRRLATFPRREGEELRVNLAEYQCHPYLALRVWECQDGQWWPVKGKGVSIRLREAGGLARVLAAVADQLDRQRPAVEQRPAARGLPAPQRTQRYREDFDEFGSN